MGSEKTKDDSYRVEAKDEFCEVFSHFYFGKNTSENAISKILFPTYQTILVFSFGTKIALKQNKIEQFWLTKYLLLDTLKEALEYTLSPGSDIFVINFKDDGFHRFFKSSFNDVAEEYKACFDLLWDGLNNSKSDTCRINFFLDFCKPYFGQQSTITKQISKFETIKAIANKLNKTERAIQISHKRIFGYTSKEITRHQRFLKAIEYVQQSLDDSGCVDWLDVVFECGYYDQSHLIHDFKRYLGLSPTKYLKNIRTICNPLL